MARKKEPPKHFCNQRGCDEPLPYGRKYCDRHARHGGSSNNKTGVYQPPCGICVFLVVCKARIWEMAFIPYCFPTSKYHEWFLREYDGEYSGPAVAKQVSKPQQPHA